MLSPIRAAHPNSKVFRTRFGNDITITCKVGGDHLVGNCSAADFEMEQSQARALLDQ